MAAWYEAIHTTKRFRLLTEKKDVAGNVYIYLKGVASLADGDFVTYDSTGLTVRSLDSTTGFVAVAKSANTAATTFSWFLVDGVDSAANVATHSSGAGKILFGISTAGRGSITPTTEKTLYGAFTTGDAAANVGGVHIRRPHQPGDIST